MIWGQLETDVFLTLVRRKGILVIAFNFYIEMEPIFTEAEHMTWRPFNPARLADTDKKQKKNFNSKDLKICCSKPEPIRM